MTFQGEHTKLEIDLCNKMMAYFDANHVEYKWQKATPYGVLDFYLPASKQIIEVKDSAEIHYMMSALGQLMFYKTTLPYSHMFIATVDDIPADILAVLKKYRVREWNQGDKEVEKDDI